MKAITEMNAKNAKAISEEVIKKLKELEALLGVEFSMNGGKFSGDGTLDLKIGARLKSSIADGMTADEMKYAENLKRLTAYGNDFNGLTAEMIGKSYMSDGEEITLIGLTSTRSNAKALIRKSGNLYNTNAFSKIVKSLAAA